MEENTYIFEGVDLKTLPKVSLHDHLDGSLRPTTILELATECSVEVPKDNPEELTEWFATQSNSGSLVEYLTTFDLTCAVMQHPEGLTRVARESVLDLAEDGVVYGELRWAPEQHLTQGLTLDQVVELVQEGINQGIAEAAHAGREIAIGQIITAMRHADRAQEIAELAVRHRTQGVMGFDIAGAELGFLPSRHKEAFDYLAAQYFPATVHAGEADGLGSIESALLDGHALRLGHGVRLAEDITVNNEDARTSMVTLGLVAQWVKDRQITLELCPTSNLQTGAIAAWGTSVTDHPFDLFYQLGMNVTVSPDNRLQSGTTTSRELWLLADAFGYGIEDLENFQLNAAASAFMPLEEREDLARRISDGFIRAVQKARKSS